MRTKEDQPLNGHYEMITERKTVMGPNSSAGKDRVYDSVINPSSTHP